MKEALTSKPDLQNALFLSTAETKAVLLKEVYQGFNRPPIHFPPYGLFDDLHNKAPAGSPAL